MAIKRIKAAVLLVFFSTALYAQNLGEFKPKTIGLNGAKKFKSKDIYIAGFSVNFQLYNLKTTTTKGGFANQMLSGNTKASLAVGLDIPAATLQQLTDEAYQKFIQDLKAQGFNILKGDTAANTNYYKDYQRLEGMEMSLSEAPGIVTVYPSNAVFFVKGFDNSGKIKREGMLSFMGTTDRSDEIASYPRLSQELNDAAIVNVDLYVLFLDVKKPYQGNGAKITANTNLRMAAYDHVESRVSNNSTTTRLGLTGNTKEKGVTCISSIDFVQGRNKIGGSPLGVYTGILKDDLLVNDVLGSEKIEAYAKTDRDFIGTETAFGMMYRADNIAVENTALIRADAEKYHEGVKKALDTFLSYHVSEYKDKHFK
ncbi:MAG TPA: hypothetical protein DCG19_09985 [Cryomorphaceae bacterium]|mgnify:CR=1 FL=1|nr:hypothetical protein [Owenweeksia sp.]MBF98187.1 hypothetical protein [Owenweeksia sp.]HAD97724.1 hypothetical protein [Cryomorphaceae bacterium]|tara:strand:+ start:7253 stop:8359 length:1107 start_codon:yes stop_codon:yes gene_type:complete